MSIRAAANAGLWSIIDVALRQGIAFVVSIILARLLLPADFGLIALLSFFSGFSVVFVQGGLSEALIQRQATTLKEESSVFWWNLAAASVFAVALVISGPRISSFYGHPVLIPLMWVAAVQTLCAALGAVQLALLTRALRFEQVAKVGVISSLISGALAVGAAFRGFGVWALAIQLIAGAITTTLMLWYVGEWRPSFHFQIKTIRHLLGFGGWLSISNALDVLYSQGFALLLGKLYGLGQLGLYNRASNTQQLPAGVFSGVIGRIALPLFSTRKEDSDGLRRGLRMAISLAMLVNVPLMAGLALLPDLIIQVLFGAKWLPAAPILTILAGAGMFYPLQVLNIQMTLARGQSGTLFRFEVLKKLVGVGLVALGSVFGVFGLAFAQLALAFIALFINVEPVRRALGYGVWSQMRDLIGIFLPTALMIAVVVLLRALLHLSAFAELMTLSSVGAGSYFAAGVLIRSKNLAEALDMVKLLTGGQPVSRP